MTTHTLGFKNPKRKWIYPTDYLGEEMSSFRQRRLLTELILSKIDDEEIRENYLSQISDDLSSVDVNEMIFELEMAKY